MLQDRGWKKYPDFKSMMTLIDMDQSCGSRSTLATSLPDAWKQYEEYPHKTLKVEAARTLFAFCTKWLVETGPRLAQEQRSLCHREEVEEALGPVPEIDLQNAIYLPRSSDGIVFKHDNDKSETERYHRAFQMLLMLWRAVSIREGPSILGEKWEQFWRRTDLFSDKEVDPEKSAPLWMRATERE
jgi:hypothetical protein